MNKESTGGNSLYVVSAITATFLWSTSYTVAKIAMDGFSPIMLAFLRFLISVFILLAIVLIKKELIKPTKRDFINMCLSGFLGISFYFSLENYGVKFTTATNASLIVGAYPIISAIMEALIYKKKITPQKIAGISLSAFGVILLMDLRNIELSKHILIGNSLLLIAGVVWISYNFVSSKLVNSYSTTLVSFYQNLSGTIFLLPLLLLEKNHFLNISKGPILALIYLSVTCSVLAFVFYNFGLKRLSSTTVVNILNLVPFFGCMTAFVLLHEKIRMIQIVSGVIIITGVWLTLTPMNGKSSGNLA